MMTGLTVTLAGSWNHSELINTPTLIGQERRSHRLEAIGLHNPYGDTGSPLAQSPPFQGNCAIRYEFPVGATTHSCRWPPRTGALALHHGQALDAGRQGTSVAYDLPAFTTYDLSVGDRQGAWTAQIYGTNITDSARRRLLDICAEGQGGLRSSGRVR